MAFIFNYVHVCARVCLCVHVSADAHEGHMCQTFRSWSYSWLGAA